MRSSWSTIACLRCSTSSRTTPSGAGTSAASTSSCERLVAGRVELLDPLDPGEPLAQVAAQLLQGVELARQLGELVVELGQLLLLDRAHGHRHVGVAAGEVAAHQLGGEGGRLAGGQADQRLVQAREELPAADLVGDVGGACRPGPPRRRRSRPGRSARSRRSAPARSTVLSVANRSRSPSSCSSISSSPIASASTVDLDGRSASGRVISGRTSTSAVNFSGWPSANSVISTSGRPSVLTSCSRTAARICCRDGLLRPPR